VVEGVGRDMKETKGDRRLIADRRIRRFLEEADEEQRNGFLRSLEGTREAMAPTEIFDSLVGTSFSYMDYVACGECKEWTMAKSTMRGDWAVKHRDCASFRFFAEPGDIPDDYTSNLGPLEMLAALGMACEDFGEE